MTPERKVDLTTDDDRPRSYRDQVDAELQSDPIPSGGGTARPAAPRLPRLLGARRMERPADVAERPRPYFLSRHEPKE